jgi:hypothetical protein
VKAPKIYFYDTGLASWLVNMQGSEHLSLHPMKLSDFFKIYADIADYAADEILTYEVVKDKDKEE